MKGLPLQVRQTLKALGFSENEATILGALFVHRRLSAKEISRETTLSFDAVHFSLHALELKGIVRREGFAGEELAELCSDESFLAWIDGVKAKNAASYEESKAILQMHLANLREASWKPNILYFEGKQGIVDIYEDMLSEGKDIYGWTDIAKIQRALGDYMDQFIAERLRRNMTSYAIMPKNPVNDAYAAKSQMRHVMFSEQLPIDGEIRIYGDNVALITFHGEKPVGFVFRGAVITSMFRAVFEQAWKAT